MIDLNRIRVNFDKELIEMGALKILNAQTVDLGEFSDDEFFLDDDPFMEGPELHFRLRNISGNSLVNLDVEINYYDSGGCIISTDSDIRLNSLPNLQTDAFTLYMDYPQKISSAKLDISCDRPSLYNKNKKGKIDPQLIFMTCFSIFMVGLFYYFWAFVF